MQCVGDERRAQFGKVIARKCLKVYPEACSHIYSHINVVFLLFTFPHPLGVSPFSQHLQPPFLPPAVHHQADRIAADIGAKPFHIGDTEWADQVSKVDFGERP